MKESYPVIIRKGQSHYIPYVPDFDISTQGETITDAIEMARDAIAVTGICYEEQGKEIPVPSPMDSIQLQKDEILTLVDVNFTAYREKEEQAAAM